MTKEEMEAQWRAPGVLYPSNRMIWRAPEGERRVYRNYSGVWVCAASKETLARIRRDFPNCHKEMIHTYKTGRKPW